MVTTNQKAREKYFSSFQCNRGRFSADGDTRDGSRTKAPNSVTKTKAGNVAAQNTFRKSLLNFSIKKIAVRGPGHCANRVESLTKTIACSARFHRNNVSHESVSRRFAYTFADSINDSSNKYEG